MKIMFNTMGLGKGGAERVINVLSNNLVKENEVCIVTNIKSNIAYKFDDNIEMIDIDKKIYKNNIIFKFMSKISILKLLRLKKSIIKFKPNVIISFLPEPSFRLLTLKKISKTVRAIPIIVSVRNDPNIEYKNKIYHYLMKKLYSISDELVLQTNDSKEYFDKVIKVESVVIPNPVSDEFLCEAYKGKREKRIVAVGRLEPQKNYNLLIDAFEEVYKKHNDFHLEIYGEGYLKNKIKEYIKEKQLDHCIQLKGQVDNVKDAIYKATAFVMSSDYEGMPNALLEAACLGIPCISTDCPCGGAREILKDGNNGILTKVNDSQELAEGIIKMIKDNEFAEKCSINGNNDAKKYSQEIIVKEWIRNIKNEVVEGKK